MLEVEGLTKYYGPKCAVNRVSFRISKGEIIGLLGLNGSGKTTILRMLSGSLLPTAGAVKINGRDLFEDPHEVKRWLSFLPETPPVYPEMTVKAYLTFAGQLKGLKRRDLLQRLDAVAASTHVDGVMDEVIDHLSFGYRQRVGIAQAVLHDPDLLLLDEPAAGLDPVQIVEMRQLVRNLKGSHTVILSSHLLSEISQICDRILMIQEGEIVGEGTEEGLAKRFTEKIKVRLQVRGTRDVIEAGFRGLDEIEKVDWMKGEGDLFTLGIHFASDVREQMVHSLVGAGAGVLEMTRTDLDLENVFLQLSERGEKPI